MSKQTDQYDPRRATPETVAKCVQALLDSCTGFADTQCPEYVRLLRAECRLPTRARAEVDAEIASECREYHARVERGDGQPPSWNGMTQGWVNRMNALCAERTAPEGPCACESSGLPRGGPGHPERCHGCPKRSEGT